MPNYFIVPIVLLFISRLQGDIYRDITWMLTNDASDCRFPILDERPYRLCW